MTLVSASSTSSVVTMEASLRCGSVLPLLFLLFICVPILEIWVIIQVGEAIGALPTIALLIVDSLVGAALMRSQGRIVWRRFNEALAAGRVPAREVFDGALVVFGGALQLAPGFVTDVFGLILVVPPTRAVVRRLIVRRVTRHGAVRMAAWGVRSARRPPMGSDDVEGTATEVDPPLLP